MRYIYIMKKLRTTIENMAPPNKGRVGNRCGNIYQEIDKYVIPEDEIIPLTEQEEIFCQSFICKPNATQSAIDAGYSSPQIAGSALKRRPVIRLRLAQLYQEKKKRFILEKEDVLEELTRLSTTDINDFVNIDINGEVKLHKQIDGKRIKSITPIYDVTGKVISHRIDFWDKNKALEAMCKYHKLFTEISEGDPSKVQEVRIGDMVVTF